MISINNIKDKNDFQDLNSKYFNPCKTVGHYNSKFYNNTKLSNSEIINDLRRGAECHKLVRNQLQNYIKPGMKIYDICTFIENSVIKNFNQNDVKAGIGFPVSYAINNVLAHDTAVNNDTRILNFNDVVKIDYGTHVNGRIIDSAFTLAFNPKYKPLLEATKQATYEAIKMAGPETYVNDISRHIDEVIESYEIELDGKVYPIKTVGDLGGHNIKPYMIHGGTKILCKPSKSNLINIMRLKEDECYAFETFASTGTGHFLSDDENVNLFCLKPNATNEKKQFKFDITNKVFNYIKNTRSTLPFCSRWLDDKFGSDYKIATDELYKNNIMNIYPPLYDIQNSYTSQLEHTVYIHSYGKEVVSYCEDY